MKSPLAITSEQEFLKKATEVRMVDLWLVDLRGCWRHVTLPAAHVGPEIFSKGVGFDGSSVSGFRRVESGDLCLIPEPETAFLDPFAAEPTLAVICQTVEADSRQPFGGDCRNVARRAIAHLRESGLAHDALFGPELEFHLFSAVAFEDGPNGSRYRVESEEGYWATGNGGEPCLGGPIPLKGGYHAAPPRDRYSHLRTAMCLVLERLGVAIKYHHHEVGSAAQSEIELLFASALPAGDSIMLAKYVVQNMARRHNLSATFMPKPLYGEAGNGLHVHQYLVGADGCSLFHGDGYAGLNEMALHYLGGLLRHGRSLSAFTNPSTNSYRRLVPGYEAPTNLYFSLGNRSAAIRIPKYATDPAEKRMEYRPPDATCNIYLATAAMLMAGLDGIRRRIMPSPENGMGPFDTNIEELPEEKRARIEPLPARLEEAAVALREDHQYLLEGKVFPPALIEVWARNMETEARDVAGRPTPREYSLYYDR